ncbi:Protein of unknown function [Pyronema omphalodes CBS 100304]|uniref:Uncharacterized protein n=1 Tax=Pyronema omphalodes (strain CBS 100304) TaxID=1076935 RepID=U4LVL1_PYROM|nr:Protein of unknown function [Pyronema omphalodes CBS 100304]
MPGFILQSG